jgi:hypothetical protein
MKLLVAGITGQLGAGLLEARDPMLEFVALARPLATRPPDVRLRSAYPERPDLAASAVQGDVTRPNWGLTSPRFDAWRSRSTAL